MRGHYFVGTSRRVPTPPRIGLDHRHYEPRVFTPRTLTGSGSAPQDGLKSGLRFIPNRSQETSPDRIFSFESPLSS